MLRKILPAFGLFILAHNAQAQTVVYMTTPDSEAKAKTPAPQKTAPKLIIAISVDQLSADLFAEYRGQFTGGFAKLQQGAVFPSGYQSHASTATCPGHATILTGTHPGRAGIIGNNWMDLGAARDDKRIYCAEDENVPGSAYRKYTVSDVHLKTATLGGRMKKANPAARVISLSTKDRAAVMMGGHVVDELWWLGKNGYESYTGRKMPKAVQRATHNAKQQIAAGSSALKLPEFCKSHSRAVAVGPKKHVGNGRFARAAKDATSWKASPASDKVIFTMAGEIVKDMKLGKGAATDLIAIGASATDYIGHKYGTSGSEMCINLMMLDQTMGVFFDDLDAAGIDYAAVLTADHGGHDLPERLNQQAISDAERLKKSATPKAIGSAIAKQMKLPANPLHSFGLGDVWIDKNLNDRTRKQVLKKALAAYRAHSMVAAAFSKSEIAKTKIPNGPPDEWSLIERVRASFHADLSGDIYVALKPRITPIIDGSNGYVATHGSIWNYDRRVPILFYRPGMARFEQPLPVKTVDIAPTLAAMIGLKLADGEMDGRCLDLDAGAGNSCE